MYNCPLWNFKNLNLAIITFRPLIIFINSIVFNLFFSKHDRIYPARWSQWSLSAADFPVATDTEARPFHAGSASAAGRHAEDHG